MHCPGQDGNQQRERQTRPQTSVPSFGRLSCSQTDQISQDLCRASSSVAFPATPARLDQRLQGVPVLCHLVAVSLARSTNSGLDAFRRCPQEFKDVAWFHLDNSIHSANMASSASTSLTKRTAKLASKRASVRAGPSSSISVPRSLTSLELTFAKRNSDYGARYWHCYRQSSA